MSLALGMDVGGTNARAVLVALEADDPSGPSDLLRLSRAERRIRGDTSPQDVAATVVALRDEVCAAAAVQPSDVGVLGLGLAAHLSADGELVRNAPNLGWRDEPFAERLRAAIPGVRMVVVNDLDAAAWGEARVGGGRGHRVLLSVAVGTGVGAGIVIDGFLHRGGGGVAGELGHLKVAGSTARCGCGQTGCVEAVAGGVACERALLRDTHLARRDLGRGQPALSEVAALASRGDPHAVRFWETPIAVLGDAIAAAVTLLNPTGLLLGGGVLTRAPWLRDRVVERILERSAAVASSDLKILEAELGNDAGALGAALLAHAAFRPGEREVSTVGRCE